MLVGSVPCSGSDQYSDLDLIIVCKPRITPAKNRRQILLNEAKEITIFNRNTYAEFGIVDEFLTPSGLDVCLMFYTSAGFTKKVTTILSGNYHKTGRYYPLAFLSALQNGVILYDKTGFLNGLKLKIEKFPDALKATIIRREKTELYDYYLANLSKAISRHDLMHAYRMIDEAIECLLYLLFTRKNAYYKGPKHLSRQLHQIYPKSQANHITAHINFLLETSNSPKNLLLKRQRLGKLFSFID